MKRGKQAVLRAVETAVIVALLSTLICVPVFGQEMVDRTVAVVSDGPRRELITYSDLLWQLALQPNASLDPPRADDLDLVLRTVVDQRIFALEADRLPRAAPTEKEIAEEISRTLAYFPSNAAFIKRLNQVGIESVKDENFQSLIARRVSFEKFIDFRFRSFVVITPEEIGRYYRDTFAPDFRRKYPGLLMPTLNEKRADITSLLTEQRVATRIESFLDDAKRRVVIEYIAEPQN